MLTLQRSGQINNPSALLYAKPAIYPITAAATFFFLSECHTAGGRIWMAERLFFYFLQALTIVLAQLSMVWRSKEISVISSQIGAIKSC